MYAESRIHPIYRLERQNCAGRSGGRLRGAGSRRATRRTEVTCPFPGTEAAVLQVGRSQLQAARFQSSECQFCRGKRDIPSCRGELGTAQRAFRVIESFPIKARRPGLIEGGLQRAEMLPVMNPVP